MKLSSSLLPMAILVSSYSIAQVSVPFMCPGQQVIAYKNGTSCTASAYNFYTLDGSGVQSPTPFYTLSNTSREVNGLGINGVDGFLYGIEYDRITAGSSCTFSNFHLVRYDAAGHSEDLGVVPNPAGGAVNSSVGCVSREGNFIFSATDGSGVRYIGMIADVKNLSASNAILTANFKAIYVQGISTSYADWAISPVNNKLYTYGIYNNGGISTGTVVEIDPVAGTITPVGAADNTTFLDIARDNFGGCYFAPNGYLYGVNINTRKLYQIDVTTGAVSYMSIMSGSGQIRADLGSCSSGNLVLPVKFIGAGINQQADLPVIHWEMGDGNEVEHYAIEIAKGQKFETMANVASSVDQSTYEYRLTQSTNASYRIRAVLKSGNSIYSDVLVWKQKAVTGIAILQNPINNGKIELTIKTKEKNNLYTIINAYGVVVKQGQLSGNEIVVNELKAGAYFIRVGEEMQTLKFIKM